MATGFAMICLSSIEDLLERAIIKKAIESLGREIIDLSFDQINHVQGNILEIYNKKAVPKFFMIQSTFNSLRINQVERIENYVKIIVVNNSFFDPE